MSSHAADDPRRSAGPLTGRDVLLDAGIAVFVFALSLALLSAGGVDGSGGELDAVGAVLAAVTSLPLAARRLVPLPVFALTGFASAALNGLAYGPGPPLGPTVALYEVALRRDQRRARPWLTAAAVGTVFVVHLVAGGVGQGEFPGAELLFGIAVWGGAFLAGDRTRLRRQRMEELQERALRAEREAERERRLAAAEERTRIARDLHDSAGHAINVILVQAGAARLLSESDPERARVALETIEEVARDTVGEIDQLVRVLREDGSAEHGGKQVEPPPGLAALEALAARHRAAGLEVTTAIHGSRRPLVPGVDQGAYRILQEALTNAARHGAGRADVNVAFLADALELSVANPLRPDGGDRAVGGGHGIVGMRERAALLGGSLETVALGDLFRVQARLPYNGGNA